MMESSDLTSIVNDIRTTDLLLFGAVLVISASVTFLHTAVKDENTQRVTFSGEINSSENMKVLNFFNESAELMLEVSDESRFYIDLDRDGSADIELTQLRHDGNARKGTRILDYRSGAYLLEYRYSDDANITDDAWLKPIEIRKLG